MFYKDVSRDLFENKDLTVHGPTFGSFSKDRGAGNSNRQKIDNAKKSKDLISDMVNEIY